MRWVEREWLEARWGGGRIWVGWDLGWVGFGLGRVG